MGMFLLNVCKLQALYYLCSDFMIGIHSDRIWQPIKLDAVINPLSVVPTLGATLAAPTPKSTHRVRQDKDSSDLLGTGEMAAGTLCSQAVTDIQTVLVISIFTRVG